MFLELKILIILGELFREILILLKLEVQSKRKLLFNLKRDTESRGNSERFASLSEVLDDEGIHHKFIFLNLVDEDDYQSTQYDNLDIEYARVILLFVISIFIFVLGRI